MVGVAKSKNHPSSTSDPDPAPAPSPQTGKAKSAGPKVKSSIPNGKDIGAVFSANRNIGVPASVAEAGGGGGGGSIVSGVNGSISAAGLVVIVRGGGGGVEKTKLGREGEGGGGKEAGPRWTCVVESRAKVMG